MPRSAMMPNSEIRMRDEPTRTRSIDKETRHDGGSCYLLPADWPGRAGDDAATAAEAAAGDCHALAFTGWPSCTRCRPWTITWSPSSRPCVTTQVVAVVVVRRGRRRRMALPSCTSIRYAPTVSRWRACWGHEVHIVLLAEVERERHVHARQQRMLGIGHQRAQIDRARGRVHDDVREIQACRPGRRRRRRAG